jgi:ubiquinone/menaquinone biosynthesis C-methylase UbiE
VVEIGAPERSPGETVIDLGSGADFDVVLADKRVGESGRVIGIDMNKVKRLPSQAVLSPS